MKEIEKIVHVIHEKYPSEFIKRGFAVRAKKHGIEQLSNEKWENFTIILW